MKKQALFSLAFLAAFISFSSAVSCSAQSLNNVASMQQCPVTPEDYAVYSVALPYIAKLKDSDEHWNDKTVLIISEVTDSQNDGTSQLWGKQFGDKKPLSKQQPSGETVEHFNLRQKYVCQLGRQLNPTVPYHFFPEQERHEFFEGDRGLDWDGFYKKYPKSSGFWSLSHVGYDAHGTEALVYLGHLCGGMCGNGELVLLIKENGHWIVKNNVTIWVS